MRTEDEIRPSGRGRSPRCCGTGRDPRFETEQMCECTWEGVASEYTTMDGSIREKCLRMKLREANLRIEQCECGCNGDYCSNCWRELVKAVGLI